MLSDAGALGSPGISMISPATATINPAPERRITSLILKSKSFGLPGSFGSAERLYCVLAIITGRFS